MLIHNASRIGTHIVVHVCATAHLPIVLVVGASCGAALVSEMEEEGVGGNTKSGLYNKDTVRDKNVTVQVPPYRAVRYMYRTVPTIFTPIS
jgi:hypothetical protein